MSAWGPSIFSDDLAADIRREYSCLVGTGRSNSQAENLLCEYYASILNCENPDEAVFWFALSLCEWKKGLLSPRAKEKALFFLDSNIDLDRWKTTQSQKEYLKRKKILLELKDTLLSPMPQPTKISKPRGYRCPWREGSLLAYRIITNEHLVDHPCYMKYALLRIIKVKRNPISRIVPNELYDESMFVSLYGWIGDEIPDPTIVNSLNFIPIEEYIPKPHIKQLDLSSLSLLPMESQEVLKKALENSNKPVREMYVALSWSRKKEHAGVITVLDDGSHYDSNSQIAFRDSWLGCTLTHYHPFDVSVAKQLEKYLLQ